MRTIEKSVFFYSELSERAKEKAREWFLSCDRFDSEYAIEDAKTIGKLFGLDIDRVYFSGFHSQGDGACFTGSYRYTKGGLKAVKDYAPQDKDLHEIVAQLQSVQRQNFYKLCAVCSHRGYYYHSGCMSVDTYHCDDEYREVTNDLTDLLREFADWIYNRLSTENDYRTNDETVACTIEENEYEFNEHGDHV